MGASLVAGRMSAGTGKAERLRMYVVEPLAPIDSALICFSKPVDGALEGLASIWLSGWAHPSVREAKPELGVRQGWWRRLGWRIHHVPHL